VTISDIPVLLDDSLMYLGILCLVIIFLVVCAS